MFDHEVAMIGLPAGEDPDTESFDTPWFDRVVIDNDLDDPGVSRHALPRDLERIPPGPFLAAIVSTVDRTRLNGHDAVRLMQAEERLVSHFEAGKLASMAEVAFSPPGGPRSPVERADEHLEYAADEIAAALTLTRRAAETQLGLALSLAGRLRRVWERVRSGLLDVRRARVIDRQIGHMTQVSVDEVLDRVPDPGSLTTGQLQARLARIAMEIDPSGVESGYEKGLEERCVVVYPNPDHTATVAGQSLAATDAAAIAAHLDRTARHIKATGDERNLDQIRADVFVDLLRGRSTDTTRPSGGVHLHVEAETLAGLNDAPGELAGYGPVFADIARQTALDQTDTVWEWELTHSGDVVATGVTRRRPDMATGRMVRARYTTCTFPGCRMPAFDCDLDHRRPFAAGGATTEENLSPLCRHHHMAKHHAPWRQRRLPNGDHLWASPLGHLYRVVREGGRAVVRPPPAN